MDPKNSKKVAVADWLNIANGIAWIVIAGIATFCWPYEYEWAIDLLILLMIWILVGELVCIEWCQNFNHKEPFKNCVRMCVLEIVFGTPFGWAVGILILVARKEAKAGTRGKTENDGGDPFDDDDPFGDGI